MRKQLGQPMEENGMLILSCQQAYHIDIHMPPHEHCVSKEQFAHKYSDTECGKNKET